MASSSSNTTKIGFPSNTLKANSRESTMHTEKITTPKALQIKLHQQREATNNNNGVGGESFRVLYYGSASAGSVPFMWESQPGTPKDALTESSLPPLTPPPSYHQLSQKYNSSMQLISHHSHSSSKRSGFLRTIFLASSQKRNMSSFSSSSSSSSSSNLHSTPISKEEVRRMMSAVKFGLDEDCLCGEQEQRGGRGGSPTSTLCLGGGFKRGYRIKKMKKAMLSLLRHA